jgi:hypothetical protein
VTGFLFNAIMTDPEEYLNELSKFVDSKSILAINPDGVLKRIYCPFPVILILEVDDLIVGDIYYVEAVKVTPMLVDVYFILGLPYYSWHFNLL